tara:strand:+ start:63 stop:515 length:453 start_codon:yes stop_codon:yes gene_type:complete
METINTNITPPADFIKKVKTYKIRFDLVKKNFEDSYDDYKKGADFGKKNVRNRKKWDDLFIEMNTEKLAIRGKSDEFDKMVTRKSKSIDNKRKNFLNKSKQDKMNKRVLTAAEPLKIQKYDKNLNTIIETIYYSLGTIIVGSYIFKLASN